MVRPEALHRFPPPHMPGTLSAATGTTEIHSFPGAVPGGRFFCSADPTPFRVALKGCKFLLPAVLQDLCNLLLSAVAPELSIFYIKPRWPIFSRS